MCTYFCWSRFCFVDLQGNLRRQCKAKVTLGEGPVVRTMLLLSSSRDVDNQILL